MPEPLRVGVLASGRGSNFRALADAAAAGRIPAAIVALICDRPGALALDIARAHAVEAVVLDSRQQPSREAHEKAVIAALDERRVGLVCLAGYMRLLTENFVQGWQGKLINIHPALLPAFPGVDAQRQAFEYGSKVSGLTIHFVDESLDAGPIIYQEAVDISDCKDEEEVTRKILSREHEAYAMVIDSFSKGRYEVEGRRVRFIPSV